MSRHQMTLMTILVLLSDFTQVLKIPLASLQCGNSFKIYEQQRLC
jgi:hypothetical protein